MRAALGDCHRTLVAMQHAMHPPDDDDGRPRDSVLAEPRQKGGCVDHLEVMLYREHQLLPVAVVTYVHAPSHRQQA